MAIFIPPDVNLTIVTQDDVDDAFRIHIRKGMPPAKPVPYDFKDMLKELVREGLEERGVEVIPGFLPVDDKSPDIEFEIRGDFDEGWNSTALRNMVHDILSAPKTKTALAEHLEWLNKNPLPQGSVPVQEKFSSNHYLQTALGHGHKITLEASKDALTVEFSPSLPKEKALEARQYFAHIIDIYLYSEGIPVTHDFATSDYGTNIFTAKGHGKRMFDCILEAVEFLDMRPNLLETLHKLHTDVNQLDIADDLILWLSIDPKEGNTLRIRADSKKPALQAVADATARITQNALKTHGIETSREFNKQSKHIIIRAKGGLGKCSSLLMSSHAFRALQDHKKEILEAYQGKKRVAVLDPDVFKNSISNVLGGAEFRDKITLPARLRLIDKLSAEIADQFPKRPKRQTETGEDPLFRLVREVTRRELRLDAKDSMAGEIAYWLIQKLEKVYEGLSKSTGKTMIG